MAADKELRMEHSPLDPAALVVGGSSLAAFPWLNWLLEHWPTPTTWYMVVTVCFMLFQMADKLGWLERFKRRVTGKTPEIEEPPGT